MVINMSKWLEIVLPATPESLDDLTARLISEGFDSFQIIDARDLDQARPAWELFDEELFSCADCRVVLYVSVTARKTLTRLRTLCPGLTVRIRDEEEWADAWKKYYHPLPVGARLLIQPSWLPLDNPERRFVFVNNPGMSFGTGLHASTRLCLEALEAAEVKGKSVLDIGCGSGILGLCALKLGAKSATGVDIDPVAVQTAVENAALNGLRDSFAALTGDFLADDSLRDVVGGGYDIIFSNIVADIVIALAPLVKTRLAPGAAWIVSGIIETRWSDVLTAAKREGFTPRDVRERDGWAMGQLTIDD